MYFWNTIMMKTGDDVNDSFLETWMRSFIVLVRSDNFSHLPF